MLKALIPGYEDNNKRLLIQANFQEGGYKKRISLMDQLVSFLLFISFI